MHNNTIIIDSVPSSLEELHAELKVSLCLPDYYGANANSLWDCLTGDLDLPVHIFWKSFSETRKNLGKDADYIKSIFEEATSEIEGLRFSTA